MVEFILSSLTILIRVLFGPLLHLVSYFKQDLDLRDPFIYLTKPLIICIVILIHFTNIVMMIFSFAGSIAKSHGAKFLYSYFAAGHVVLTAASLGLNYAQIQEVSIGI